MRLLHGTITPASGVARRVASRVAKRFSLTLGSSEEDRWARISDTLHTLGRVSRGTTLTPYYDTGEAYKAMWKAVDEAQHTVIWHTFIYDNDTVGTMTVRKLIAARARGVAVEFLYDSGGQFNGGTIVGRRRLTAELRASGATAVQYRPFPRHVLRYFTSGMNWRFSPGLRNHRKVLLVDDRIAFIGGLNVGDDYAAASVGGNGRFRDTMCAIEGAEAMKHVKEVCVDTVQNQDGSAAHPSLQQRWRQWARRAAPIRIRAHLYALPRLRRARLALRRQVDRQRARLHGRFRTPPPFGVSPLRGERVQRVVGAFRRLARPAVEKRDELIKRALGRLRNTVTATCHAAPAGDNVSVTDAAPPEGQEPLDESSVSLSRPCAVSEAQVLMCNPHTRDWSLQRALWIVSREAQSRLWVTTPYFLPNGMLFRAVLRAAKNGVDVRIVAGSYQTTDPWFMWFTAQYVQHKLLSAGVKLYEFEGGQIMHAKTVVVDGRWACIGSYNWDILSNKLLEASVAAHDAKFARTMEEHFLKDLSLSREVTADQYARRSLALRMLCAFFYYGVWLVEKLTFFGYADKDLNSPMGRNVDP